MTTTEHSKGRIFWDDLTLPRRGGICLAELQNRCSTAELTRPFDDLAFSRHQLGTDLYPPRVSGVDSKQRRRSHDGFLLELGWS